MNLNLQVDYLNSRNSAAIQQLKVQLECLLMGDNYLLCDGRYTKCYWKWRGITWSLLSPSLFIVAASTNTHTHTSCYLITYFTSVCWPQSDLHVFDDQFFISQSTQHRLSMMTQTSRQAVLTVHVMVLLQLITLRPQHLAKNSSTIVTTLCGFYRPTSPDELIVMCKYWIKLR